MSVPGHEGLAGGEYLVAEGVEGEVGWGGASTSQSRSPIDGGAGEGDDDGWVENNTPLLFIHLLRRQGCPVLCQRCHLVSSRFLYHWEFCFLFVEETNDYAYYQHKEMCKKCTYAWSGVGVEDIAHYLGIVMWMGIIGLPEMQLYWARNMTFSLSAFPQTMARRRFEAIQ